MLANKVERVPDDLIHVRLDDEFEVRYWCAKFSVTPEELRACVFQIGTKAEDVKKQLRNAGREAFKMGGED